MSRESVAQRELDKAEAKFRNTDEYNKYLERFLKDGVPVS